jgi:zinc protease
MKNKCLLFTLILFFTINAYAQNLPKPEKFTLKNGITVLFHKDAGLPLIAFTMSIKSSGSANENKEGLASLTARLLNKGTSKKNSDQIAEELDFLGGRFSVGSGDENTSVSGNSLSENFEKLFTICAEVLSDPAFPKEDFDKEKAKMIEGIKSTKDNPSRAVGSYFRKAYFGSHPFGKISTEKSIESITQDDVKSFYKSYYVPSRTILAVAGNIEKNELQKILNNTLGKWENHGKAAEIGKIPAIPKPSKIKLLLIDKNDANQAYFMLGMPGIKRFDPSSPQSDVMNTLFGGRFTSWLNSELRIKRGLTYGARSGFMSWNNGGVYYISSYTKNDKIGEMLDIVFELVEKAKTKGFEDKEIESSRNYILGQFPPTLESLGAKTNSYVDLYINNQPFDYYSDNIKKIANVSKDDVGSFTNKLFSEKEYVLVIIGKSAEIKEQLKKFGTWEEKSSKDEGF